MIKAGWENTLTLRVAGPILMENKRIEGVGQMETPQWRGAIAGGIWQSVKLIATGADANRPRGTVADFMSTEVETMSPNDSVVDAARRFLDKRYHRYPVLDNNRLVGQISRRDVLRALGDAWQ